MLGKQKALRNRSSIANSASQLNAYKAKSTAQSQENCEFCITAKCLQSQKALRNRSRIAKSTPPSVTFCLGVPGPKYAPNGLNRPPRLSRLGRSQKPRKSALGRPGTEKWRQNVRFHVRTVLRTSETYDFNVRTVLRTSERTISRTKRTSYVRNIRF